MLQTAFKANPKLETAATKASPLQRLGTPEEVADYILFLCSSSASFINGTGLIIDSALSLLP